MDGRKKIIQPAGKTSSISRNASSSSSGSGSTQSVFTNVDIVGLPYNLSD